MNMNNDIIELIAKVEQLLAMLESLEKQGDRKAALFADDVRYQLFELRKATASSDNDRMSAILLDIVPSAKALDAIDFRINLHPEIDSLRSLIQAAGARIAKPLIDAL